MLAAAAAAAAAAAGRLYAEDTSATFTLGTVLRLDRLAGNMADVKWLEVIVDSISNATSLLHFFQCRQPTAVASL
jgi:hypothetical protein